MGKQKVLDREAKINKENWTKEAKQKTQLKQ